MDASRVGGARPGNAVSGSQSGQLRQAKSGVLRKPDDVASDRSKPESKAAASGAKLGEPWENAAEWPVEDQVRYFRQSCTNNGDALDLTSCACEHPFTAEAVKELGRTEIILPPMNERTSARVFAELAKASESMDPPISKINFRAASAAYTEKALILHLEGLTAFRSSIPEVRLINAQRGGDGGWVELNCQSARVYASVVGADKGWFWVQRES